MRCGPALAMIVLLLGALPAQAQDSPGVIPKPKQTDARPAKEPVRHRAAVKPAERKLDHKAVGAAAATTTKTAAIPKIAPMLPQPKPADARTSGAKTSEPKPAKTAAAAPAAPKTEEKVGLDGSLADIPPAERLRIQAALLWSGDFTASTGEDPLVAAIKTYQKRSKTRITGALTPSERAALVAAAKSHEKEYGWSVVVDAATGIRIGLPTKMVPLTHDYAHGTRWSSVHGEVKVETFRYKEPGLTLAALFEREKKEPASRRIEQSALNDDGFTVSGLQGLKMFAVRAKMRDGEIRGYTVFYDQMMEGIVAPVTAAMAAAFSPFPERGAPFATLAKSVEYGNGLVVSAQGHIVTDLNVAEGCQVIIASGMGAADRVAVDRNKGIALLRVYGQRKLSPLELPRDAATSGDVRLVGIPDPREQNGSQKIADVKARLGAGNAIELRQPAPLAGLSGAAALNAQGHVLGMMEMGHAMLASVDAAPVPPVRLVTADTIRAFLATQHVPPVSSAAADPESAVVRIICVRQ